MSNTVLFPNKYKKIGWFLIFVTSIVGIFLLLSNFEAFPLNLKVYAILSDDFFGLTKYFSVIKTNITPTLTSIGFIIGSLLICFSKEKNEDEFISNLRLSSLIWSVLINYILLLFALIFVYGTWFLNILLYNMFTVLILFIIRFHYLLYKYAKLAHNEK